MCFLSGGNYGNFDVENKVDYYKFKISSEQLQKSAEHRIKLHVGSLVPRCSPYQNICPTIALLGPEQNSLPANIESSNLPFSIPNGSGITVFNMPVLLDRDTTKFYEEHSKKWYWWGIKQDVYIDVPGEYMITIWESQATMAQRGNYKWLVIKYQFEK